MRRGVEVDMWQFQSLFYLSLSPPTTIWKKNSTLEKSLKSLSVIRHATIAKRRTFRNEEILPPKQERFMILVTSGLNDGEENKRLSIFVILFSF